MLSLSLCTSYINSSTLTEICFERRLTDTCAPLTLHKRAHQAFNFSADPEEELSEGTAMAFMVKHMVGGQLKNLTGGLTEEKPEGEKSEAAAQGMTQEEFEQYQQQLEEEK